MDKEDKELVLEFCREMKELMATKTDLGALAKKEDIRSLGATLDRMMLERHITIRRMPPENPPTAWPSNPWRNDVFRAVRAGSVSGPRYR